MVFCLQAPFISSSGVYRMLCNILLDCMETRRSEHAC